MASITSIFDLTGKVALFTGSSRGIGAAMALALARAGADMILVQRSQAKTDTYEKIKALGRKVFIVNAELSNREQVSEIVPKAIELSPTGQIDILVNNAGVARNAELSEYPLKYWDESLEVNLTTPFILSKAVGTHQIEKGIKGKIINVGSIWGIAGGLQAVGYAAAKAALIHITKSISNEWAGKGINVNCIAPGLIETDMSAPLISGEKKDIGAIITASIPKGRVGQPEDFDGIILFLASGACDFVTGLTIIVDGGRIYM